MKTTKHTDVRYCINRNIYNKEVQSGLLPIIIKCPIIYTFIYAIICNCNMIEQDTVLLMMRLIFILIEFICISMYFVPEDHWSGDYLIIDRYGISISYPNLRVKGSKYTDCRDSKMLFQHCDNKNVTSFGWTDIESIEFRFSTIPSKQEKITRHITRHYLHLWAYMRSIFTPCLCVTTKMGDEVWTAFIMYPWTIAYSSQLLSEIRNIERAVYRFTGRTDLTVNRIRYSDMCYCLVPLASFQPYKK